MLLICETRYGSSGLQNISALRLELDADAVRARFCVKVLCFFFFEKGFVLESRYALRSYSLTPGLCEEGCVRSILCDMTALTPNEFSMCASMLTQSDWSGTLGLVGGMIGLAFIVMTIAVLWRRRQVMLQTRSMAESWTFQSILEEDYEDVGEPPSDSVSENSSEL